MTVADIERVPDAQAALRLSDREIAVMALVADGLTNYQIGRKLLISGLTVKSHLARIARKLGCSGDRAGMVAICFRRGLLK